MTILAPHATAESSSVSLDTVFRPPSPKDSRAVVYTFAVAARIACAHPFVVGALAQRLESVGQRLIPPESLAFGECRRLWGFFSRVALLPKPGLRQEAGRALYRELDALSERLDMPSLPDWDKLPTELMATLQEADAAAQATFAPVGVTLAETQQKARQAKGDATGTTFVEQTGLLLRNLDSAAREGLLEALVRRGDLTRSEVNLLVRFLAKEPGKKPYGQALMEALERLGSFLAADDINLANRSDAKTLASS